MSHRKKREESKRGRIADSYFRLSLTVLIIFAVLYVAAQLIARTDGFLYLIEDRLSESLGLDITVEEAQLSPALVLQLKGVSSKDSEKKTAPSVTAEMLNANFDFSRIFLGREFALDSLSLSGFALSLVPNGRGQWLPEILGKAGERLTEWVGVPDQVQGGGGEDSAASREEESGRAQAKVPPVTRVTIQDGKVRWRTAEGATLAAMDGFELVISSVSLPRRQMMHYDLSIKTLQKPRGELLEQVRVELLSEGESHIVMGYDPGRLTRPVVRPEPQSAPDEPVGIQEALREAIE
ncbi:MAG: hypothetical protein KJ626_09380 [Verrucomicrobia bacterium]|nr:hypothetical protein [Verrucomicrobiota bacterium]